jgi:hypothetical protein
MANTAQKKWMETITEWYHNTGYRYGSLNECYRVQRHHVVGRKGKHNKVDIGHWFVLPLPFFYHDVSESNNQLNITHHKNSFTDKFGLQSELFSYMISSMIEQGIELPFGTDVINAIEDTRR